MEIAEFVETIESKEDFIKFIELLRIDYEKNQDEWENKGLDSYLEGIRGFVWDIEGYWKNHGKQTEAPSWKLFARILKAARFYE